jgi:cyclopropane-fatty-acyl-phospholipid synthase
LREWVAKIEAHQDEVLQYADERSHRIWRLYMAGLGHAFRKGKITLH